MTDIAAGCTEDALQEVKANRAIKRVCREEQAVIGTVKQKHKKRNDSRYRTAYSETASEAGAYVQLAYIDS